MPCDCIKIDLIVDGEPVNVQVFPNGNIVNNAPQFENIFFETNIFVEFDGVGNWIVYVGNDPFFASIVGTDDQCPFGIWPVSVNPSGVSFVETSSCEIIVCPCTEICITKIENGEPSTQCSQIIPLGIFNGLNYYEFELFGNVFSLYFNGNWRINILETNGVPPDSGTLVFTSKALTECPVNVLFTALFPDVWLGASTSDCSQCKPIEDRTKREFKSIRLPKQFIEQKRGFDECCSCPPMLVLASNSNETWKNDVTSAWIKLSDQIDTIQFVLEKNGVPTNFVPTPKPFVNEQFAFYTTINWIDVFNLDGIGCFTLKVNFNISGINGSLIWGVYDLREYSIENALKTARIKVKYNLKQEIEQIDFTGSNVVDTFRFYGFIGNRQPNMEIDNLIYQNREMKSVVRENLNSYIIETDPLEECQISKLTDLLLLSENEMFISDYNAHNHSYKFLDIPVIVQESPEIDYLDKFQRRAILKCVVGDKFKNKRTYFK